MISGSGHRMLCLCGPWTLPDDRRGRSVWRRGFESLEEQPTERRNERAGEEQNQQRAERRRKEAQGDP